MEMNGRFVLCQRKDLDHSRLISDCEMFAIGTSSHYHGFFSHFLLRRDIDFFIDVLIDLEPIIVPFNAAPSATTDLIVCFQIPEKNSFACRNEDTTRIARRNQGDVRGISATDDAEDFLRCMSIVLFRQNHLFLSLSLGRNLNLTSDSDSRSIEG